MNETDHILKLDNVTKTFGAITAVNDLSLTVPPHTVFGLLGPNGAGKTTMLRMVMGLMRPSKGSITLFGGLLPGQQESQRLTGYMPQHLSIYPGLSVLENLMFFGRIYDVDGDHIEERVEEVLEIIELSDRKDAQVSTLSGGSIRRVLLGTALVHKPKFLLLDEPTAGIDPVLRLKIWDTLEKLRNEGTSIIITTHHISEASRCGRVVFLRDGAIISEGSPDELMERYGTADLEASFVKATMTEGEGE